MNPSVKSVLYAIGVLAVLIFILAANPFVIIKAGERGVVLRFGAVQPAVLDEGLHFRIPFADTVIKADVKILKDEQSATSASKDLQVVTTKVVLNFHLDPTAVNKLYQQIGPDYQNKIINPAIHEAVKAVTARFTAEELITNRPKVKEGIKEALNERLPHYHVLVDDLSITDFDFSKEFNAAIESKQTAEQLALKAKRDLDRIKIEADQKVATARAEAEGLRAQKQEITPDLIKLREIEMQREAIKKWDGRLPQVTSGAIPFLDLDRVTQGPSRK